MSIKGKMGLCLICSTLLLVLFVNSVLYPKIPNESCQLTANSIMITSIQGTPKLIWSQNVTTKNIYYHKLVDIMNDSVPELLIASKPFFSCYNATDGGLIWNISVSPFDIIQDLAIGNISGTLQNQIVMGYVNTKILSAINAITPVYLWNTSLNFTGSDCTIKTVRVGNVLGDSLDEIIVGTTGAGSSEEIHVLNKTGGEVWKSHFGGLEAFGVRDMILKDLNNDTYLDIIAACDKGVLQARNGSNGGLLWGYLVFDDLNNDSQPDDFQHIISGDITGDKEAEILVSSNYKVYALNGSNGESLWNFTLPASEGGIFLGIGNLDEDQFSEIVCAGNNIVILFHNGTLKLNKTLSYSAVALLLNDFNADNVTDLGIAFETVEQYDLIIWNGTNPLKLFHLISTNNTMSLSSGNIDSDPYKEIIAISNQKKSFQCYKLAPDLFININQIEYYPSSPTQGEIVAINFTIKNIGGLETPITFNWTVFVDEELPTQIIDFGTIESLAPDKSRKLTIGWNTSNFTQIHALIFVLDSLDDINEGDESNNREVLYIQVKESNGVTFLNFIFLILICGILGLALTLAIFVFFRTRTGLLSQEAQQIFESFTKEKPAGIASALEKLMVNPLLPLEQIGDKTVQNYLSQDFTLLSPTLVEQVVKLKMSLSEKIHLVHELIQLSPSSQEKLLAFIERNSFDN